MRGPVALPQTFSPTEVDRLGELERRKGLAALDEAEYKALKDKAGKVAEAQPADKPCALRGELYELQLGPRRKERTIIARWKVFLRLRKALGLKGIICALTIPIGLVDENIPKSEQAGMVSEEQSGWRSMSLVALQPAEKAEYREAA